MSGRSFGYARVSTDDQNLTLQLDALTSRGIPASQIFKYKLSGAKCDRPGLMKCLDVIESGDILVVWRLDRLGRSMRRPIALVEDRRRRGVGFRSLQVGAISETTRLAAACEDLFAAGKRTALYERDEVRVQILGDGGTTPVCAMNIGSGSLNLRLPLPLKAGGGRELYSERSVAAGQTVSCTLPAGNAEVFVLDE